MMFRTMFAFIIIFIMSLSTANAELHRWEISELFSNADGSIQFIELFETRNEDENHLLLSEGENITSTSGVDMNVLLFPSDLPSEMTASRFFLIATAGFSGLAGAVTPDYIMSDSFLFTDGGTVNFAHSVSIVNHLALPVDGTLSLQVDLFSDAEPFPLSTGINSPTNFAGDIGSVSVIPVPAAVWLFASGLFGLVAIARRRV